MARAKKKDVVSIYSVWDARTVVMEARNLVRWNPPLAIKWMESAANRVIMQSDIVIDEYNKAVEAINEYLDQLERMAYYDKVAVWGIVIPSRLEQLEGMGAIAELYRLD